MSARRAEAQADLFAPPADHAADLPANLPDGFRYQPDLIDAAEAKRLAEACAALPMQPFNFHGFLAKRQVASFGWHYDYGGRALQASPPIPDFLMPLRDRVAAFAGVPADGLQQVLINRYDPGAGIGWHRDKPMFEDVIAVSLLAPALLRLRRRQADRFARATLTVAPRSAYLLRGAARTDWEHSLPPVEALRLSITFRNLRAGHRP